ncbi:hypothetical protein Dimus_000573, partial [Dionaea muscipula]
MTDGLRSTVFNPSVKGCFFYSAGILDSRVSELQWSEVRGSREISRCLGQSRGPGIQGISLST